MPFESRNRWTVSWLERFQIHAGQDTDAAWAGIGGKRFAIRSEPGWGSLNSLYYGRLQSDGDRAELCQKGANWAKTFAWHWDLPALCPVQWR